MNFINNTNLECVITYVNVYMSVIKLNILSKFRFTIYRFSLKIRLILAQL